MQAWLQDCVAPDLLLACRVGRDHARRHRGSAWAACQPCSSTTARAGSSLSAAWGTTTQQARGTASRTMRLDFNCHVGDLLWTIQFLHAIVPGPGCGGVVAGHPDPGRGVPE